ncbi:hypothetical protein EV421DRAFT_1902741 [Armillaria borealis]|uniref:Uncharacterized protein n=1 Tax=Armillaria borealis TaxID=47425 RepID=A0AA39JKY6_9AGAR|nr:hypothetical protein EV421DRAFT_1902741 [Armillaria borealis]
MVHAANSWSSPPPLYSTFPGPDNHARTDPSNERTPLNSQTTRRSKCSYTLKIMIGLLLFIAFTWHCVNDYSNTHRTDVQERIRHREELDRLKRIEHEDKMRKAEKEREDRIIRYRESQVARREQNVQAKENAMREDEERRKRAGLTWQDLTPEKRCLSYEKRMYQAKLMNIPYGEGAQS